MKGQSRLVRQKAARIAAGGRPRVLDLFSGCGGLSLGFHRAGFRIAAAIEFDPFAAASHGPSFHRDDPRHSKARDITRLSPEGLASQIEIRPVWRDRSTLKQARPWKRSIHRK
jgi:DNA (cytosine-5)-methyltransferase 1